MIRNACFAVCGALALIGCGSGDGNTPAAVVGAGGMAAGASGFGGVPGPAGMAAAPGGGAVGLVGAGGSIAPAGTGGAGPVGVAGTAGVPVVGSGGVPGGVGGAGASGAPPAGAGGVNVGGAGVGGAGGDMSGGGMAGMGGAPSKPPCLKNASEVVFLGDSYVNYDVAHPLLGTLIAQRATMDGALMAGQAYRNYAVAGATMAAASLNMIPPQWPLAKMASPDITVVIMDGGGNDVLINNPQCKAAGSQNDATCKQVVQNTVTAVSTLIDDFQKTGVKDLIYFFYPHAPTGGADISDYALGILQNSAKLVTTDKFRMYVVDLVPLFAPHPEYFYIDGIHANATGEGVIADAIYKVMKDNCIAQPQSKGCCMP